MQWGWFWLPVGLFLVAIQAIVVVSLERSGEMTVGAVSITVGVSLVVMLVLVMFSRQVVEVHPSVVSTWFGVGWPRRDTPVEEIAAVRRVENSRWWGYGIRAIPNGWMYNSWGTDAVELGLASGKVFRIGTADPEGLAAEVALVTGLRVEYPSD